MELGIKSIEVVYRESIDVREQNAIPNTKNVHGVLRAGAVHLGSERIITKSF